MKFNVEENKAILPVVILNINFTVEIVTMT